MIYVYIYIYIDKYIMNVYDVFTYINITELHIYIYIIDWEVAPFLQQCKSFIEFVFKSIFPGWKRAIFRDVFLLFFGKGCC